MARIRSIKPEFWESEKVARLPALDALTFIGLISMADDHGRGRAEARAVLGRVHPLRPGVTLRGLRKSLARLQEVGLVTLYDAKDGCSYYWIRGFSEHQKVDHPAQSKLPPPPYFADPREDSREPREDSPLDQGSGIREGKGRDQGGEAPPPAAAPPPITGGSLDHLHRVARTQKIAGRPETIRQYVESWAARVGAAECERMLMESTGKTVLEIQDKFFPRNGTRDPMTEALNKWAKEGGPK